MIFEARALGPAAAYGLAPHERVDSTRASLLSSCAVQQRSSAITMVHIPCHWGGLRCTALLVIDGKESPAIAAQPGGLVCAELGPRRVVLRVAESCESCDRELTVSRIYERPENYFH